MAQRQRLPPEVRRNALLDAAAAAIVTGGLDAVTMEGVSIETGGSRSLAYHYFDNVEEMLVALFAREMADFDRLLASRMDLAAPFETQIRAIVTTFTHFALQRGYLYTILTSAQTRFPALRDAQRRRVTAAGAAAAQLIVHHCPDADPVGARLVGAVVVDAAASMVRVFEEVGGSIEDLGHLQDQAVRIVIGMVEAVKS